MANLVYMSADTNVLLNISEGLATVTLQRPERRNALIGPLFDELAAAFTSLSQNPEVNAVLLHGAQGAFCSGLDLKEYKADPPPPWLTSSAASASAAHKAIYACPVPVVGALERFAINGGASLALACDLLVAGQGAYLQVAEIKLGMAAPLNLTWLHERFSVAAAQQLVLTGRKFFGPDLHRLGIALEVVKDDQVLAQATQVAREIAQCPPQGVRALKAGLAVGSSWESHRKAVLEVSQQALSLPVQN
ncbi:MAG: enoyl-CoA hydratase/isomerase family protein [Actinobacteria bacterium]|jgi:enoyl-CoA hydratase/carnithine racemase|nr:enoyl-CoA hydratase/isomerase family protein [Actinomycetota bacterium]